MIPISVPHLTRTCWLRRRSAVAAPPGPPVRQKRRYPGDRFQALSGQEPLGGGSFSFHGEHAFCRPSAAPFTCTGFCRVFDICCFLSVAKANIPCKECGHTTIIGPQYMNKCCKMITGEYFSIQNFKHELTPSKAYGISRAEPKCSLQGALVSIGDLN